MNCLNCGEEIEGEWGDGELDHSHELCSRSCLHLMKAKEAGVLIAIRGEESKDDSRIVVGTITHKEKTAPFHLELYTVGELAGNSKLRSDGSAAFFDSLPKGWQATVEKIALG